MAPWSIICHVSMKTAGIPAPIWKGLCVAMVACNPKAGPVKTVVPLLTIQSSKTMSSRVRKGPVSKITTQVSAVVAGPHLYSRLELSSGL